MQVKRQQIEKLLRDYPESRNSDRRLTVLYWNEHYGNRLLEKDGKKYAIRFRDVLDLPSTEEIGRHRRKIQSEGLYLPTSEAVARQRKMNIDKWKIALGYTTPTFNRDKNIEHGL